MQGYINLIFIRKQPQTFLWLEIWAQQHLCNYKIYLLGTIELCIINTYQPHNVKIIKFYLITIHSLKCTWSGLQWIIIIQLHSIAPHSIKRISKCVASLFFLPIVRTERKFRQYGTTGKGQTNSFPVEFKKDLKDKFLSKILWRSPSKLLSVWRKPFRDNVQKPFCIFFRPLC